MKSTKKAIIFQVPEELKADAQKVLDHLGIDTSKFLRKCLEELVESNKNLVNTFNGNISDIVKNST